MKKILITTSSFGKEDDTPLKYLKEKFEVFLNPYGCQLTTEEFIELSKDCDGVIAGTEMITRNAMEKNNHLKVISRCGVGVDNIDLLAANEFGIKVLCTPDAPTIAVAELTVALILDLSRQISIMDAELKKGIWKKRIGNLIKQKNVAIIGMGRIGSEVSRLLSPFGVEIRYYDIENKDVPYERETDLCKLLAWADITTLHCAIGEKVPLIGKDELSVMKKTVILINTSRGKLINEEELYNALREKRIKGAALDVYENEPYNGNLRELDNVVLTPHIASSAMESRVEMEMQASYNLVKELFAYD